MDKIFANRRYRNWEIGDSDDPLIDWIHVRMHPGNDTSGVGCPI